MYTDLTKRAHSKNKYVVGFIVDMSKKVFIYQ